MDESSLYNFSLVAVLGFGALMYFYFTYKFFNNWYGGYVKEYEHRPPFLTVLMIVLAMAVPPILIFYLMIAFGPVF